MGAPSPLTLARQDVWSFKRKKEAAIEQVASAFVHAEDPCLPHWKADVESANERHRSWLKRLRGCKGQKDAWRPKKRHRQAALKWIACIDNQLKNTSMAGLQFLVPS